MPYTKQIILVFGICSLLLSNSYGCFLVTSPIAGFDDQEFVFIGKVIGYTGPYQVDGIKGEVWGIRVTLEEKVFLPRTPSSGKFEVFRYWLGADCSHNGTDEKKVKEWFPMNSQVRVIAQIAKALPRNSTTVDQQLEVNPRNNGSIVRNDEGGKAEATATSVFEYKPELLNDSSNWSRVLFEVRKDFVRLEMVRSHKERKTILRRMEPIRNHYLIDYERVSAYYDRDADIGTKVQPRKKR